ncbi:MAG: aminoacyl-tRNA hydrolase [Lentisphaeria bacterium]
MVDSAIKLIVGLGNPGKEYENTRHNIGFTVIDNLCKEFRKLEQSSRCRSEVYKVKYANRNLLLQKPLTYMNLSGEAVKGLCRQEGIKPEEILVIYDCLDLPVGTLRLKESGSSGGQKGMESIIQQFASDRIMRMRIGINSEEKREVVDFVLGTFSESDQRIIDEVVKQSCQAILCAVRFGIKNAMNQYNGKVAISAEI